MKVSVLVPVYGVEKYIGKCAESLFAQTYDDLEYIFVNDCTPDNSIAILNGVLDKYPKRKHQVKIINHDKNRGSGAARKTGLGNATGDFIAFVDSDDFITKNAIELLVKKQEETNADIVDGAFDTCYNNTFGNLHLPYKGKHYVETLIIQNVEPHQLWGRIIRRQLFTDNDIDFTEGINQAEDYSVIPRLMYYARRSWTDGIVYHYRIDRIGTFTDGLKPKHVVSYIKANKIIIDFFKDKGRSFSYPLHIGLINAAYNVILGKVGSEEVDKTFGLRQSGFWDLIASVLLSHPFTAKLAKLEYLILKRLYIIFKGH